MGARLTPDTRPHSSNREGSSTCSGGPWHQARERFRLRWERDMEQSLGTTDRAQPLPGGRGGRPDLRRFRLHGRFPGRNTRCEHLHLRPCIGSVERRRYDSCLPAAAALEPSSSTGRSSSFVGGARKRTAISPAGCRGSTSTTRSTGQWTTLPGRRGRATTSTQPSSATSSCSLVDDTGPTQCSPTRLKKSNASSHDQSVVDPSGDDSDRACRRQLCRGR